MIVQVVIMTSSDPDFTIISLDPFRHRLHSFCIATSGLYWVFFRSARIKVGPIISSGCFMYAIAWSGTSQSHWLVILQSNHSHPFNHMWSSYTRSDIIRSLLLFMYECCLSSSSSDCHCRRGGGGGDLLLQCHTIQNNSHGQLN